MRVRTLPAVVDAYDPISGVFYDALSGPKLFHQYADLSRSIMEDGNVPLSEAMFFLLCQPLLPNDEEEKKLRDARSNIKVKAEYTDFQWFDKVFVSPNLFPIPYTFGKNLVIPRALLDDPDLDKILAHELGHLNNGDSIVTAAFWALGKGDIEYFTPLGIMIPSAHDAAVQDQANRTIFQAGAATVAGAAQGRGWLATGLGAAATLFAASNAGKQASGRGVADYLQRIISFMQKWDIEADILAETLFPSSIDYLAYLERLARNEKTITMFSVPAANRFLAARNRLAMESTPAIVPDPTKPKPVIHKGPPTMSSCFMQGLLGLVIGVGFWIAFFVFFK